MGSGTLISRERRATTTASGGSTIVHRCSLTVEFTQTPRLQSRGPHPAIAAGGKTRCRSVSRILSVPPRKGKEAAISLGRGLLLGSSDLPESVVTPEA